jgi:predicted RND superfamily exporter protein
MGRIAHFIFNRSKLIIRLVVILNIIAVISFIRFKLDTEFLSFFAGDNPKAVEYNRLNEKYQTGETLAVLIEQDSSLLDKENIINVLRVQEKIKEIDGVAQVQSFIPTEIQAMGNIIPINIDFVESDYQSLRGFIENRYFLKEQFLSSDGHTGIVITVMEPGAQAREIVKGMKEIVKSEGHLVLSLAGTEIIQDTLWNYLIRIIFIFPPCAVLLVLLVFYTIIRNRMLTILAIIPAALAALWTFGTIFWSGQGLNIVTAISPIFIIVIGSAYGLHYVSHFQENLPRYSDRRQLTVETLSMVGVPILLATITTMAGFISLTWAKVIPMTQMGIFVTMGIGYAGFLAIFFLPAVLSRIELPSHPPQARENRLFNLLLTASRQRALVISVFIAIVGVSAVFVPTLEVVSNQLMFFKKGTKIRKTFSKVEKSFGGAVPLTGEIVSNRGQAALSDHQFVHKVLDTERELERVPGIKSAFSIFDLAIGINKMITGENIYPRNPMIAQLILMQLGQEGIKTWVSDDGLRLMVRTQNIGSSQIAKLEEFVTEHPDTIRIITGMPVLFDEMNKLVVQSQVQSLGLALALVFLMLVITLRRIGAALAGLTPIVITITAILGMLAISKFHLNILTANLSAIAVGVGVDYSIHLISGIYHFRKLGLGKRESVDSALASVSKPVLANAFGLAIGLSVLFFSPLRVHLQAASVMWVAMVISSMAALLLIPIFYSFSRSR